MANDPTIPGQWVQTVVKERALRDGRQTTHEHDLRAFVPDPLPPKFDLPALHYRLFKPLVGAERALGLLEGTASRLPNPHILISPFVRREAAQSSAIEDTIASQEEIAVFQARLANPAGRADVQEVSNYINALNQGLESTLPLSLRLVRQLHRTLLGGVRGDESLRNVSTEMRHFRTGFTEQRPPSRWSASAG